MGVSSHFKFGLKTITTTSVFCWDIIILLFCSYPQANVTPYLPPLLLGTLGMLSGIAALFLPETRGQSLPETVTQAQQFK